MIGLFDRLGLAEPYKPKLKQTPTGVFVGTLMASGEAESFSRWASRPHFPGVDYVGPSARPGAALHHVLRAASSPGQRRATTAKALDGFSVRRPPQLRPYQKRGMEPG